MHTMLRKEYFESGGDHTEDPAAALALLSSACGRLERLARGSIADSRRQYHLVVSTVHDICGALTDCEASGVSDADIRETLAPAREIHGRSPFVTRLQQWPRGYAGDFETIEWLWCGDNRAPSGTLAYAIENYALNAAIAQQHRNKVTLQAACMLQAMATSPSCRVLSIGCGSSPDLRTIVNHVPTSSTFVLCDSDKDALNYSRAKLHSIADRCRFVHGLVPRVLRRVRDDGPYDLILAGGLFDYLSDRFIVRTLADSWNDILAPGGRIVFTNIARGNPFRVWIEYLAEWKLIERSEEDIARICAAAGISAAPVMVRDATALAIVVTLNKEQ
jgi:extracellular factor (EF) 3-hydroxypalmitic acid methyl ester biosynthesis protein